MKILLAPMEGVVDAFFRELLSSQGGIDRCVTEFLRVTDHTLPQRVFTRICPELLHNGLLRSHTLSGTPVYLQLLGSDPQAMASNAEKAASLGACGIDLNFGCPAKTVNRSDGGSILLREPERVFRICLAVRDAVPADTPVTGKMRLGYEDKTLAQENALAMAESGISEVVIHARTKIEAYTPPAWWAELLPIRELLEARGVNLVANGEVWNPADAKNALQQSGCNDLMLGRGLLACPSLALNVKNLQENAISWPETMILLQKMHDDHRQKYSVKTANNRIKQWLGYLKLNFTEAGALLERVKRIRCPLEMQSKLEQERVYFQEKALPEIGQAC